MSRKYSRKESDYDYYSDSTFEPEPVKEFKEGEGDKFEKYIRSIAKQEIATDKASVSSKGSRRSTSSRHSTHSSSSRHSMDSDSSRGSRRSTRSVPDRMVSKSERPIPERKESKVIPFKTERSTISKTTIKSILDQFTAFQIQQMCAAKGSPMSASMTKKAIMQVAVPMIQNKYDLIDFILGAFPDEE